MTTTAAPPTDQGPPTTDVVDVATAPRRRVRRSHAPVTITLLVCSILLQRVALPLGLDQVPLTLPVTLVLLLVGFATREFRLRRPALRALLVLYGATALCALGLISQGMAPSLFSMALLVSIYPVVALVADLDAAARRRVEKVFLWLMSAAALASLAQMGVQFVGVPYEDYLLRVVPESLVQLGFNTGDVIQYGETLVRANGVVFLEPSFVSAYLGLAISLALYRGGHPVLVTIMLAGMIPPVAGSGFVVLGPTIVLLLFTRRRRHLLALVPALLVALTLAFTTPIGERYLARSSESGTADTSSTFRLVAPYQVLMTPSLDEPGTALVGHGAGSAEPYLKERGLTEVTVPVVPKVFFEYGLVGLLGIVGALVALLLLGLRRRPWAAGLAILFIYVNASLLQNTLVLFTFFWLLLLPVGDELDDEGDDVIADERDGVTRTGATA